MRSDVCNIAKCSNASYFGNLYIELDAAPTVAASPRFVFDESY